MIDSMEKYAAKYEENTRIEGFGEETAVIAPCPFCAEPGWLRYKILETEKQLAQGAECRMCGRGAKVVFTGTRDAIRMEFVQTAGDDPPAWFTHKMRRVDPAATALCLYCNGTGVSAIAPGSEGKCLRCLGRGRT